MDNYKVVALFGPAGSGKDYLQKKIMETSFGEENLSEIISHTTRPPREGEMNGVDYHFVSPVVFMTKQYSREMLETTEFRGWYYGTAIDALNKDKINIGVFNPQGIFNLLKDNRIIVFPVYVKATDKCRLLRQLQREEYPDCEEICRRFTTDKTDFQTIPFDYSIIYNDDREGNSYSTSIDDLVDLIEVEFLSKTDN